MSLLLLFNQAGGVVPPTPAVTGPGGYRLLPRPKFDYRYRDEEEAIILLVAKYLEKRENDETN
jgi:hypothetical protein